MAIIKQYHKDTDTVYVYESTSYWDPEKKQSRSKRRCIGKVDPDTGEIIPTGRRGRKPKEKEDSSENEKVREMAAKYEKAATEAKELQAAVSQLQEENEKLRRQNARLRQVIEKAEKLCREAL